MHVKVLPRYRENPNGEVAVRDSGPNESFEIVVKGRTQFFVSTKRLKRVETPDESGPRSGGKTVAGPTAGPSTGVLLK